MRMTDRSSRGLVVLAMLVLAVHAHASQRGLVTGIAVSPDTTAVGAQVTATITGRNPCGAVFIDWADGTAITYPLHEVPATQTHRYERAGTYTVVARGMGNCDGEAVARLRIDAPPAPSARLTGIELAPNSAPAPAEIGITVTGSGKCAYRLDYGDGNSDRLSGSLPDRWRHVYNAPNTYTVRATAESPCEGTVENRVRVLDAPAAPKARVTGIALAPDQATAPADVEITVAGSGQCAYLLEYGDGNSQRLSGSLPDRWRHVYNAPNTYTIKARAEHPCEGVVEKALIVRDQTRGLTRLVVSPTRATTRSRVTITLEGRGTCPVTVDFGDGTDQKIESELPARITHTYSRAGKFEIFAWTDSPCTGEATGSLIVRRPR